MLWMSQGEAPKTNNVKFGNTVAGLKRIYLCKIVC